MKTLSVTEEKEIIHILYKDAGSRSQRYRVDFSESLSAHHLGLAKACSKYVESEVPFVPYARIMMKYAFMDLMRDLIGNRRKYRPDIDTEAGEIDSYGSACNIEDIITIRRFMQALSKRDDKEARIMKRVIFEGFHLNEVAAELGVSKSYCSQLWKKIRKKHPLIVKWEG